MRAKLRHCCFKIKGNIYRLDCDICTQLLIIINCYIGTWGDWVSYGPCSQTCGNGIRTRTRVCLNGMNGDCLGSESQSVECNDLDCGTFNYANRIIHNITYIHNNTYNTYK